MLGMILRGVSFNEYSSFIYRNSNSKYGWTSFIHLPYTTNTNSVTEKEDVEKRKLSSFKITKAKKEKKNQSEHSIICGNGGKNQCRSLKKSENTHYSCCRRIFKI
jgi:hypothetical protein